MNVRKHSNLLSATTMRAWHSTSGHSITYDGDRERLHEGRSDRGQPPRFSATQRRIGDPQRLPYRATPPSTSHSMAGTSERRRQARRRKLDCTRNYRVSAVDSMREFKECIMYVVACGLYKVLQISHQIRTSLPGCHPRPKHSGSFFAVD